MKQVYLLSLAERPALWPSLRDLMLAQPDFRATFEYAGHLYYEFGQQAHPEAPPDFDLSWQAAQVQLCRYDYEEPWAGLKWLQPWLAAQLGEPPTWQPT
jgi:hypothetical protein